MKVSMGQPAAQFESLGGRAFSFYPPIVGIEHNEWEFQEARWSEVLVKNSKTCAEVWIPRNYLGEVSKVDEPVMIVGLKRELEFKSGSIWPHTRRVIEMPGGHSNPRAGTAPAQPPPAKISELRLGGAESKIGKAILAALAGGLLLAFVFVLVSRQKQSGGTVEYQGVLQAELGFGANTDYFEVVRKLGPPEEDKWQSETGERQVRMLRYPKSDIIVFLMGSDREGARYIGAKNNQWRNVHSVKLPGGFNTDAVLRSLKPF